LALTLVAMSKSVQSSVTSVRRGTAAAFVLLCADLRRDR
jgi:hypothetical protein